MAALAVPVGTIVGGRVHVTAITNALPGQIRGRVTDTSGSDLPGVTISVTAAGRLHPAAVTDATGTFVLSNVSPGLVTIAAELSGFVTGNYAFVFDQQPRRIDFVLPVGPLSESVTVAAETRADDRAGRAKPQSAGPSQNVIDLQRRTAGVLPVRVDVPRAGTSHEFVKPLVVDQEATVTFRYARR
jgi:hypothetical protein